MVPRVPPLDFNYGHTSPEFWLSDGDSTTVDYSVNDIKICTGNANTGCNGSDLLFSIQAHLFYLAKMGGCRPFGLPFRRATSDIDDPELEEQLSKWSAMDRQTSITLGQSSAPQ